jgi:hypothetical protein
MGHNGILTQDYRSWFPRFSVGLAVLVVLWPLAHSVGLLLAHDWSHIQFPYPVDYGEGPILNQVLRLAHFRGIYPTSLKAAPFTVSNYPPLYPLAQVPFYWLFGPAYWYGRTISLVSILAASVFIGLTLYAVTKDRIAAILGGALLLAFPYVLAWSAFCRVDSLALGLSWAGLFVVVFSSENVLGLATAGALFVAAIYTRQSYALTAPLAAFVWLLRESPRRRAWVLAAWTVGLTAAAFLLLEGLTRGGFFFNIVTLNINAFNWREVAPYATAYWKHAAILVVGGAAFVLLGLVYRPSVWWLGVPYLLGAVADALTVGKAGSSVNYMFELCAALSFVAGAMIALPGSRWLAKTVLILFLAFQAQRLFTWTNPEYSSWDMELITHEEPQVSKLFTLVQEARGPVLADEFMGLEPLARKPLFFQPFELNQMAARGVWDEAPLLDMIKHKQFPLILIYTHGWRDRWTHEEADAIEASYVRVRPLAETMVWVPRQ